MKLYEITGQMKALEDFIPDIDNPEDAAAFSDLWSELNMAFESKAENVCRIIKNSAAEIDALKAEEERLYKRRKALENKNSSLKTYLQYEMETNGLDKIKTELFSIGIQNNPASVRITESALPDEFWRIKKEPDTSKVKAELKAGNVIPGATLEQTRSIRIR